MYQTYAAVGSVLLILGVVYTYLIARLYLGDKKVSQKILALSEAIVTVFIGVFYVYSSIVLSRISEKGGENTDFINTIDSIIVRNNTDSTYQMVNMNDIFETQTEGTTEKHVTDLPENITNQMVATNNIMETQTESRSNEIEIEGNVTDELPENVNETTSQQPVQEKVAEPNKADEFLQKYQSFIKEMMKDKLKNGSFHISNQTYPNLKKEPSAPRAKRDIQLEEEKKPNCYYEFFIHNALLIYSFVHCLITMVNNTLHCKNCIKKCQGSEEKKNSISSQKDWTNDSSTDSNSEKNDISSPVGPLFEIETGEPNDIPNLKLFEARTKETSTSSEAIQVEEEEMVIKADMIPPHIKLALQVLLTYLLPVLGIVVLYCVTSQESLEITDLNLSLLNEQNFTTIQTDGNILNRIQTPTNITNTESLEVDRVIKNVYNIVNQVRENTTKKTTYFSPMMVETLYFIKPSHRNPKVKVEKCPTIDQSIKTYYFFIFIAAYFAAILYAKVIHIDAKSKKVDSAKEQNMSLLTFSALWLPSVLDIFFRMFVTQEKATVFSDLFLALGNSNRIYTMASNHIQCKKSVSKPNFIQPEPL